MNVLVKCFKENLARPRSDQGACEAINEHKLEDCQRKCENEFTAHEPGNEIRCVEFTMYTNTNDWGFIEGECCTYMTPSSTYDYKVGAISGPPRCGRLLKSFLVSF